MLALLETFPLLDANPVCKKGEPCLYFIPHIVMTNMPYSKTTLQFAFLTMDTKGRFNGWEKLMRLRSDTVT